MVVRLRATVTLVRFLSSNGTLTTFESLGNSLSANGLRLTVQLPTDAPGTPKCACGLRHDILTEFATERAPSAARLGGTARVNTTISWACHVEYVSVSASLAFSENRRIVRTVPRPLIAI
jgi:hypothetical protein